MNGPMSPVTDEPVWERPWSLEEIGRSSQNWSLAADAGLLNFLQEFSHQTISRTHDIEKQLDGLVREAKATECRLHNIFNDFLMLSNTQFLENRVYDEEVEERVVKPDTGEKPEQEKTREQKEVQLIPKIQEAVNYGLQVLETAFEKLDIKAGNSDSEDEEVNERLELILEPKDLYIDRPLPFLIGSQLFMQQEDVGLGDLSSEEGSVDNDRGSAIDSEEEDDKENDEESDEDFGNDSEEEKKPHPALSDEDEDNGSDLFGDSDKEDEEDHEKTMKTRTKSFADELAARIQSEVPKRQETDESSISSVEVKNKKEKGTREARKLPSDDEEDDIFKPPKLTDEDFFGNKGGLFSGGKGIFDDDDDDDDEDDDDGDGGEGDLFSDVQKKQHKITEPTPAARPETLPSDVKKKPPYGGVSLFPGGENVINSSVLTEKDKRKHPTPTDTVPKPSAIAGLFDDDDVTFGGAAPTQPSGNAKQASDLFADEDDLFNDRSSFNSVTVKPKETEAPTPKTLERKIPTEKTQPYEPSIKKKTKGLFSDEEDSESDLFSPSQAASKSKTASVPETKISKSLSLFDDEDDDLFGSVPEKKLSSSAPKPVQKSAIPSEVKTPKPGLFSSDEEDPVTQTAKIKPLEKSKKDADVPTKLKEETSERSSSLFDEDDDLFAITKDSQKKTHRVSLLFEDDANSEEPLFSSGVTKSLEQPKISVSVKKENEKVSLVDDADKKAEPKVEVKALKEKLPPLPQKILVGPVSLEESDGEDLFASSSPPPAKQASKVKTKNVLSLFGNEDEDIQDQLATKITQQGPGKDSVEKSTHGKRTGVFQDEELLFSQELQRDNDPDVDLFASTNKKSSEKPKHTKLSTEAGLFCDDDNDDLFGSAKPKKPPKVQEKKIIIKNKGLETCKESGRPSEVNDVISLKTEEAEKTSDPAPIKTKTPSSRIGKLQANLLINPAALLPGAVPKLSGARAVVSEQEAQVSSVAEENLASNAVRKNLESASFESPAQVDALHNANKTRVKASGKRRPPTRMGRKLASQDSGENGDPSSPISPTSAAKTETGLAESNWRSDRGGVSSMKLSFSENDIQPRTHSKVAVNPLTPDVNDLFGSDFFAASSLPNPGASRQQKVESPGREVPNTSFLDPGKKSSAVLFDGYGTDDDLFKSVKDKPKKTPQVTSLIDKEPEDDLFGFQKPQKKVDVPPVVPKEKFTASILFKDDLFEAEDIKAVKKPKEKKVASETNLFDDNTDIFADITHKPKEKKSKKKAEPKSIFHDDMDDIFSASVSNVKKTKSKSKSTQQGSETKADTKVSTAFDDPLNVLGK
ncbi:WASH complex subunit 2C-like isoform X2 [Rhinoderma darwinii]|uniref:WASH complex subunit 2C-like isoform X2 n=1 Tax=Rhinoderma darwinii TaxID=43563 RepID=UPI003F675EE1